MPEWIQEIRQRLAPLKLPALREAAIIEELSGYLDDCYSEFLASGINPSEAYQQTLRELGSDEVLMRELRRVDREIETTPVLAGTNRSSSLMTDLWHDLRYGARMLWKHRGVTTVAVLSLALGIGANTAIFSFIDAVLLKMLPVEKPDELVFIQNVGLRRPDGGAPPYPCFERFRDESSFFAGMAAFADFDPQIRIDGQLEEVRAQRVSGNYFSLPWCGRRPRAYLHAGG